MKKVILLAIAGIFSSDSNFCPKYFQQTSYFRSGSCPKPWNNNPGKQKGETYYTGLTNIDRLSQSMTGRRVGEFNYLQFGTDYDLTPKSNLAAGIRMQSGNFTF